MGQPLIIKYGMEWGIHCRRQGSFALIACFLCFFPILSSLPLEGVEYEPALTKDGLEIVSLQLRWFHQFQFAGYYAAKEKGFLTGSGIYGPIIGNSSRW